MICNSPKIPKIVNHHLIFGLTPCLLYLIFGLDLNLLVKEETN